MNNVSWLTNYKKYRKELSLGKKAKERKMMNLESNKKSKKFWTTEEVRYLKKHWGHKTVKELSEIFDRTPVAIRLRASREGLLRKKKHRNRTKTTEVVQQNFNFDAQKQPKDVIQVPKSPVETVKLVGNPRLKSRKIENGANKKENKATAIQVVTLLVSLFTFLAVISSLLLSILSF